MKIFEFHALLFILLLPGKQALTAHSERLFIPHKENFEKKIERKQPESNFFKQKIITQKKS